MIRLATVNGVRVHQEAATVANSPRPYARLADCGGEMWRKYQDAKQAWDRARISDDPNRESYRQAAIFAHDAWALASGVLTIQNPERWGFN